MYVHVCEHNVLSIQRSRQAKADSVNQSETPSRIARLQSMEKNSLVSIREADPNTLTQHSSLVKKASGVTLKQVDI